MNKGFIIAIDGPVASGKGTLAVELADKLQGYHLYTGAMYRSIGLLALQNNININSSSDIARLLPDAEFEFKNNKVYLNGEDVTEKLKNPEVAASGSIVATYPAVRRDLVKKQQDIAQGVIKNNKIVIAEGRDTGTVVFPDASLKIFLTATPEIRAKRRLAQYKIKGINKEYADVLEEITDRDRKDTKREISPLTQADDAILIDTTSDEVKDTVNQVLNILKQKGLYD
jgi:cytidylate kinase